MATLRLNVPDAVAPRVLAAWRALYPDLTDGKTDEEAAVAVLKHHVRADVTAHEGRVAQQQVEQQRDLQVTAVKQKAWSDLEGIS